MVETSQMPPGCNLQGKICVVTGASRGLGKGIALGLGEAGATVYVMGRTLREGAADLPGSVESTAAEVTRLGGKGFAVACDQRNDHETAAVFERVRHEHGRLDILVNASLGSPPQSILWGSHRFWKVPISLFDDLITIGLRSHYVAAWHAVPLMIERGAGVIVNVGSHACGGMGKTEKSVVLMAYSIGKAGLHRLTNDLAIELKDQGITALAIWPPASRTEGVLADQAKTGRDLSGWKQPIFTGRVLAALLVSADLTSRSGQSLAVNDLAREFSID